MKTSHRLLNSIAICFAAWLMLSFYANPAFAQHPILDANDPIVNYDPENPPTTPDWGTMVKWVRTQRLGWNTDDFKSYFYKGMPFRVMWPKNYDASGNTKYPMIIMLHGRGERGTIYDNEYSMKHGGRQHRDAVNNGNWPGFVLYPQNTTGYFAESHFSILNDLINNHFPDIHVDINRISVHGLSAGGQATWNTAIDYPKDYAAALPMSAAGLGYLDGIASLQHIPIWISQGGRDSAPHPNTTETVVSGLWDAGVNIRYTLYPNLGHGVWNTHYNESDFFPFMQRAHKANPVVTSGESALVFESTSKEVRDFITKREFCPGETITVPMGLTAGFEDYQWRKDGVVIPGANNNIYTATELGVYEARILRAGEWSEWSPIPVEVKIKEATQTPDISVVGLASKVIPSPDGKTAVELELPNGYIEYAWFQENNLTSPIGNSRVISITEPGNYVASVVEKFGCSSNVSAPFKVVDANGLNAPDNILGITATPLSKTEIQLDWSDNPNPVNNETAFEIYRTIEPGTSYDLIAIISADVRSYVDSNLLPDNTYYYIVRGVNEEGASDNTIEVSATTLVDDIAPLAPLNLKVSSKSLSTITLSWDESTDDVGIDKYEIYKGPFKAAVVEGTSGTVFNLKKGEAYAFTVKARDFAGNLSPASNQIIATPGFSGLNYKYYEGSWSLLPDFNSLTPLKEGLVSNVDISVRDQDNDFGFLWEGYINITNPGTYTFETRSDDGSKLYIGGYEETNLIVDNDGLHGMRSRSGNYTFNEAGAYPIAVTFFERGGGQGMEVYWSSNEHGIARQRIPDEVFIDEVPIPTINPAAPTNVTAEAISFDKVALTWFDESNDETGFQVYQSETQSGPYFPVGIAQKDTTSFTISNLQPETQYFFQVIALGPYGQSEGLAGPAVSVLPMNNGIAAIDNATGSGFLMYSEESVHSRFSSNPPHSQNADHVIAVRNLNGTWQYDNNGNYYSFSPTSSDLLLATVDFGQDQVNSLVGTTGNINGIEYGFADGDLYFRANRWGSTNNSGEFFIEGSYFNRSVHSAASVVTLPLPDAPLAPQDFSVEAQTPGEINLSWSDLNQNEKGTKIYRSVANNTSFLLLKTLESNVSSYVDTDLLSNTTYFYKIEIFNEGGNVFTEERQAKTLNNNPVLAEIGDISMRYETTLQIPVVASDPDQENLSLTVSNSPSFVAFTDHGDGTGSLTLTPAIEDAGFYEEIVISVADENNGYDADTISIVVDSNNIPILTSIGDVVLNEGETLSFDVTATDTEGVELLSWTDNLPAFGSVTPHLDGTATVNLQPEFANAGQYNVLLRVADQDGGIAEQQFTITVIDVDPNQKVLINMVNNTTANQPWNNINSLNTNNLIDENGSSTGISISFLTSSWKTFRDGAITGDNSGIYPDNVIRDYYYFGIFGAPETVDVKIAGLDPAKEYSFSFFGSSKWANVSDNGTTVYTIGNESTSVYVQNNSQNTGVIDNVVPDQNGEVTFTMSKASGTPVGYLNALSISYTHDEGTVPAAPRELTASLAGSTVGLEWIDAPFNESGYSIFKSVNGTDFVEIGSAVENATSYSDNDIAEGETYFYAVKSYNAFGTSDFSNVAQVSIPNTPPSIAEIPATEVIAGSSATLNITATDPSAAFISMSATNLPLFAGFSDNGNGTAQLVLSPQANDIGVYEIIVSATDDQGASSSTPVVITVSENVSYSVAINFSGNFSSSGWNNTNKNPQVNDSFENLRTTDGLTTGINVTLNTAFGGVYADGAITGDNSGIVPDNVLREYYWFGIFSAPEKVQMTVSGLDSRSKYNFKFVGSSVFTGSGIVDNGSTIYKIGNKQVAVDVQGNTSNMGVISNIIPSGSGQVIIEIEKAADASVGYINALIIDAFEGEEVDQTPTDFIATGSSKTSIQLDWTDNSYEELGYEIYRGDGASYSLLATVASDITTFVDSGLNPGDDFSYKVRAILPNQSYTEYSNTSSASTMAFAILINLNGDPIYNASQPWNNLGFLPDNGVAVAGFKDEFGEESGIVLDFKNSMSGSNDWGTSTGNDSGIYPDKVLKSFFFMEALETANIVVKGLDQSFVYNFKFLGAIETGFNVFTVFSIGNESVTNSQTYNTSIVSTIKGVQADINNSATIDVVSAPGSRWSIWNSLVIEAYPNLSPMQEQGARTARTSKTEIPSDAMLVTYGDPQFSVSAVSVYPNPISEKINIRLETDNQTVSANLVIFDLEGKKVTGKEITIENSEYSLNIEDLNMTNGIYILQLTGDGFSSTTKLYKNN
jgi:chitodextrinase/imidazole glycerol phosphate synthase subunit HisF